MLKFIFMVSFIYIYFFYKKNFWMAQSFLFLLFFLFILKVKMSVIFVLLSNFLGVDLISLGMILLSVWIVLLMVMASNKIFEYKSNLFNYMSCLLFMLLMLIFCFSVTDFFLYYLFFESSLIPVFFLILGWGYQSERLQAGFYLLFYTLLVSLPLLMAIFYCNNFYYSTQFYLMNYSLKFNLLYFALIGAFLVKMPMFFVHLWLPKAHVEAPISGSMILAGVLLKLGGYGLLRVFSVLEFYLIYYNLVWYIISLWGGVLISLVCLCQVDMKSLIAYSSVVHMGVVVAGLMTLSMWGFLGSYVLMIGHGLCSSGLFCLANLVYERTSSRSLFINKGLMNYMPSMALWWFLLCSSNMAAPPSLNLVGEIMLLNSVISWSNLSMILLMFLSFFSAAYSLYLFSYSQQGNFSSTGYSFSLPNCREYSLLMFHWLPLNILILKLDVFIYWL